MRRCPICNATTKEFGRLTVLGRHEAVYRRCGTCEFIHVEDPCWLEEAYARPIARSDIGLVDRNLQFARTAQVVIEWLKLRKGRFIDYGGGTGLFTRHMRDNGYDFFWYDRHCQNYYAERFEASLSHSYELLTASEVLEHLVDPLATIQKMAGLSRNLLFMTQLIPEPPPAPGQWWYYGEDHGQHVSFFARKTLDVLACKIGLKYATNGHNLHFFSPRPVSSAAFKLLTCDPVAALLGLILRRPSLLPSDFRSTAGQGK